MSNSTTCSEQKTLDREREFYEKEIVRQLTDLVDRLERLEEVTANKLNQAYQQGVADERKARTGHDPKVADDV
jgi:uncharacterized protein (UPF0335 family)